MSRDPQVTVLTAAMCEGNKLQKIRDEFPDRFFDTGICEGHAVAFAAGMAKSGLRPIVDIYSTFLQRSYDQIFQEVALQNLPVTFCLDRAGLCGPDGPTHHGVFDNSYMRVFPNMVLTAPGDALEMGPLLEFALAFPGPVVDPLSESQRRDASSGPSRPSSWAGPKSSIGEPTARSSLRALLGSCVEAARRLREEGLDVGVINARFAKPLDTETILRAVEQTGFVLTVEEEHRLRRVRLGRAGSGRGGRRRCWQHPLPGYSGPLHRARRARRTAGRPGPRRQRPGRRRPGFGRRGDGCERLNVSRLFRTKKAEARGQSLAQG